ncbi:MAG: hypothetical protein JWM21_3884 [Acidobacteria bacterium]|nr:hypothetical protein [Acidobacteriota bacterium]
MYDLATIKTRGQEWISRFRDVGFVGDLEVSEHEISELAPSVGKYTGRAGWDDEICAALAVVVVNLAYYSPDEIEEGFRWQVLHKLFGRPLQDVNLWQEEIGGPILRLLSRHFYVEDLPGPFRYVRPIMLQAGVPARLGNAFAAFFVELIRTYGIRFSESDYREGCDKTTVQSPWLKSFLRTNGWEYCRDVARIISNLEKGIFDESDVSTLMPRFRLTVKKIRMVMARLPSVAASSDNLPMPRFVLDRINLRLALEFSEKGLEGRYQWLDGTKVRAKRYMLKEHDFGGSLGGKIVYPSGKTETWKMVPWRPEERSWAVFRNNDGSLEISSIDSNMRKVRAGRHLVALPEAESIPEEFVIEVLGDLYLPGFHHLVMKVFDCDLPPGFELPSIGFAVGDSVSECFPELSFVSSIPPLPHTTNAFVGELPEIRIEHWNLGFAERYVLIQEDGTRQHRVPEHLYRSQDTFHLPLGSPPLQGRIYIEPKGRTPKGFWQSPIDYVLLPKAKLVWPIGLNGPDQSLIIELEPGDKFRAEWQQISVERIGPGQWRVPPKLDFVDGQITYQNSVSFHVAGAVHRFTVQGDIVQGQVVWQDRLRDRSTVSLSLSSAECGRRIDLGVADRQGFVKCIDLGPVPRNSRLEVSTDSIRDAFQTRARLAGRLAVRVSHDRVVCSDIVFLHDRLIEKRLFDDPDEEFGSWIECVPHDLRVVLNAMRDMHSKPVKPFSLQGLVIPEQLHVFLLFYEICARILDWQQGSEELSNLLEGDLRSSLTWYVEARYFVEEDRHVNPAMAALLLSRRPQLRRVIAKSRSTPNWRWRNNCAQVIRALRNRRSFGDYKRMVVEWTGHCRRQRWQAARQSRIGRLQGGQILTKAAEDYHYALEGRSNHSVEKSNEYFFSSIRDLELTCNVAVEGLVWEIASALRLMIFFHTHHPQFFSESQKLVGQLGSHWGKLHIVLSKLSGNNSDYDSDKDSLGLSDITPHEKDIELEEALLHD